MVSAFDVLCGSSKRQRISTSLSSDTFRRRRKTRKSDVKTQKNVRRMIQPQLDVGQSSLGEQKTCPICSMIYVIHDEEDRKAHSMFCNSTRGISWKVDGNELKLVSRDDANGSIYEVVGKSRRKKLQLKALLDKELGHVNEEQFLSQRVFVYLRKGLVCAVVTVEDVFTAYELDANDAEVLVCDTAKYYSTLIGISQIWVDVAVRRKSVASKMIDAIRKQYIYGMDISRDQIAFSQPTRKGKAFAERYMEPHPLLVYRSAN